MTLSAPKQYTFWIAVILWVLALLGAFVDALNPATFAPLSMGLPYWLAMLGGLILALGNLLNGL